MEQHRSSCAAANRWASQSSWPIVVSEYVLVEVANYLSAKPTRSLFAGFLRALVNNPQATVVPSSPHLFERETRLFIDRADKAWSLTDCISFEIMRERGIRDALSADKHFEQAGFNVILKAES